MYKQKLTLDPKCTAVREAVLTVFDEKPLGSDIRQHEEFEVVSAVKSAKIRQKNAGQWLPFLQLIRSMPELSTSNVSL